MRPTRLRRRRAWLAAVAALALLTAGYAAVRIASHETSRPASVRQALARFRALPAAHRTLPSALTGRAPSPGTYVYATSGFEVTRVLGTRRHAYPARTTITVTADGARCLRSRWDVLATRWDAVEACLQPAGPGWALRAQSEEHAFAGHLDRRTYACTDASTARPARLVPGARWTSSCAIEGTTTAGRGVVLGLRTLAVAGRPVRTVLLRTRTRVSGDTTGTGTTLTWIRPGSGLVVRRVVANASSTGTIVGDARYEERFTLALTSLRPLR